MVMDVIRTPYKRKCRIFSDSDKEVTLSWYPAPPGAQFFPFQHLFASGDWCSRIDPWPGPGEIKEAKRRYHKANPPPVYFGECFVGEPEWYRTGVPLAAFYAPRAPVPECCRGNQLYGGPVLSGEAHLWHEQPFARGGVSLGGTAPVHSGRLDQQAQHPGLLLGGAAGFICGRGGIGHLWGGIGPGGILINGWSPPPQTGLSLSGAAEWEDLPDNEGDGGLAYGGTADCAKVPNNSRAGGLAISGSAGFSRYDPNSILTPACSNRINYGLTALFDLCTGSLAGLAGTYQFGHTTGFHWECGVTTIGNGTVRFALDFGVYSPFDVALSCNCMYLPGLRPLGAACYPFRLEYQAQLQGQYMLCGIPKTAGGFRLVITPMIPSRSE